MSDPIITRLEVHQWASTLPEVGRDDGYNLVYEPGGAAPIGGYVLRVMTDVGVVGEYAGGTPLDYAALPTAIDAAGNVPVPQGPGLGVAIDWAWVDRHRVGSPMVYTP